MNLIQKSILKVVVFFDLLDYPVSALEIWKFLDVKIDFSVVRNELVGLSCISCSQGLYFLRGRDSLVETRLRRYALADLKFKKVLRVFRFFPWVRNIAVYSSVSFSNARPESDIDLFVIAREGRVWSCRFFLNLFLKVFGLRRNGEDSRDKICLSFLVDESGLDLSFVKDENELLYIYGQFIFFQTENRFFLKNLWLKEKMPNWFGYDLNSMRGMSFSSFWKKILEIIFGFVSEKVFRDFQLKILPLKIKRMKNLDFNVVVNDKIIKLHDNDKVEKIKILFSEKFKSLCPD